MNYNFTDGVRRALMLAREEAVSFRHDYVATEHLLMGLLREPHDRAWAILKALNADPALVRARIEESVPKGDAPMGLGELPYTSRAKKTLEFAMAESREMQKSYYVGHVCTEHLLLGLLREEHGKAAIILNEFGVTLDAARAEAIRLAAQP